MSGTADIDLSAINTNTVEVLVDTSGTLVCNGTQDFIFVKNTDTGVLYPNDVQISLQGNTPGKYMIKLKPGEVFASKVKSDVVCYVKTFTSVSYCQFLEASI